MCAGVQNVSRPMEMCHEISQYPPNASKVTAAARHHTYHRTALRTVVTVRGAASGRASKVAAGEMTSSIWSILVGAGRSTLVYHRQRNAGQANPSTARSVRKIGGKSISLSVH